MGQILARTLSCKEAPSRDTHNRGRVNEDKSKKRIGKPSNKGTYDSKGDIT